MKKALNLGVTFIDKADDYGLGRSEEIIGEVIKETGSHREDLIIAAKGLHYFTNLDDVKLDNRPEYLRLAVENSLKRLQTDYIDLYYLHYPDIITPFADSIGELAKLKAEGKIRAIGISTVDLDQLNEESANGDIDVIQAAYNMIDCSAENEGIMLPNLALAWLLAQDGIDAVIPGSKTKQRIQSNVTASDINLTRKELDVLDTLLQ